MDNIQFATILWSFLFGLFIGIWIGQIAAVKEMIEHIKKGLSKKEEPKKEEKNEEVLRSTGEESENEPGIETREEETTPGIVKDP